jgi:hypothetical protein
MSYLKPDVFVSIELGTVSPNITEPSLKACMVGPHYFVANKKVHPSAYYDGSALTNIAYPDIPSQFHNPANKLQVDLTDGYVPKVFIRTPDGVDIDITGASGVSVSATSFSVPGGLKYSSQTNTYSASGDKTLTGNVLVSYRALSDQYVGKNLRLLSASSVDDLIKLFGEGGISYSNPLGFAMYNALLKGQRTVYGMAVGDPLDATGNYTYNATLTSGIAGWQVTATELEKEDMYVIVPLTLDMSVVSLFKTHADKMSAATGKKPRIVIGSFMPDAKMYYFGAAGQILGEVSGTLPAGTAVGDLINFMSGGSVSYSAPIIDIDAGKAYVYAPPSMDGHTDLEVSGKGAITSGSYTASSNRIYFEGLNLFQLGQARPGAGDTAELSNGSNIAVTGVSAGSPYVLVLSGSAGAVLANNVLTGVNIFRYATLDGTANTPVDLNLLAVYNRAAGEVLKSMRVMLLSPGYVGYDFGGGNILDVESFHLAAAVAGEISAKVPGTPIGVDPYIGFVESRAHPFYSVRMYSEEQLDQIAGGGVAIVVNDRPGLPVYLRHTLTTDMTSIESQELILQVARDSVAMTYIASLRTLIRRYRIGDQLDNLLPALLDGIRTAKMRQKEVKEIVHKRIYTDPNAPDTVNVELEITHFYPVNRINVTGKVVAPKSTVIVSN